MNKLYSSIKLNSKRKGYNQPTITIDEFIQIFKNQGGLCAYSRIPMQFGSYRDKWWIASTERKDVSIGYEKSNICFICYEFNTVIHRSDDAANSGWSKNKMKFLKEHIRETKFLETIQNIRSLFDDIR